MANKKCVKCNLEKDENDFSFITSSPTKKSNECKQCISEREHKKQPKKRVLVTWEHKVCVRCKEDKLSNEFYKSWTNHTGLFNICKECCKQIAKEKKEAAKNIVYPIEKKCKTCGIIKPTKDFYKRYEALDGLSLSCIMCKQEKNIIKLKKEQIIVTEKECYTCKVIKPANMFRKNKYSKDGLYFECSACAIKRRNKKIEQIKAEGYEQILEKVCFTCQINKPINNFIKDSRSSDGHLFECKECNKKRNKIYYENKTQERIDRQNKRCLQRYYDNKKRHYEIQKKSNEKNKDKILIRVREWENKRYRTDINFQLKKKLRIRLRTLIKANGALKTAKTLKLLGLSFEEFKNYFSSKFSENISFDKVISGEIHIDHIIPCDYFKLINPIEQHICFNYRNLQPLWGFDNNSKCNKLPWQTTPTPTADDLIILNKKKATLYSEIFPNTPNPYLLEESYINHPCNPNNPSNLNVINEPNELSASINNTNKNTSTTPILSTEEPYMQEPTKKPYIPPQVLSDYIDTFKNMYPNMVSDIEELEAELTTKE